MMKKNLNVDAMILDLRNVQEDFLDRYEQIKLDTTFLWIRCSAKMSLRRSRWVWSMARSR